MRLLLDRSLFLHRPSRTPSSNPSRLDFVHRDRCEVDRYRDAVHHEPPGDRDRWRTADAPPTQTPRRHPDEDPQTSPFLESPVFFPGADEVGIPSENCHQPHSGKGSILGFIGVFGSYLSRNHHLRKTSIPGGLRTWASSWGNDIYTQLYSVCSPTQVTNQVFIREPMRLQNTHQWLADRGNNLTTVKKTLRASICSPICWCTAEKYHMSQPAIKHLNRNRPTARLPDWPTDRPDRLTLTEGHVDTSQQWKKPTTEKQQVMLYDVICISAQYNIGILIWYKQMVIV